MRLSVFKNVFSFSLCVAAAVLLSGCISEYFNSVLSDINDLLDEISPYEDIYITAFYFHPVRESVKDDALVYALYKSTREGVKKMHDHHSNIFWRYNEVNESDWYVFSFYDNLIHYKNRREFLKKVAESRDVAGFFFGFYDEDSFQPYFYYANAGRIGTCDQIIYRTSMSDKRKREIMAKAARDLLSQTLRD